MRIYTVLLALFGIAIATGLAQGASIAKLPRDAKQDVANIVETPKKVVKRESDNTYRVDFKCEPRKPLAGETTIGLFFRSTTIATQTIIVSTSLPALKADGKSVDLPAAADIKIAVPIYSVNSLSSVNNTKCDNSFYIAGAADLSLVSIVTLGKSDSPSAFYKTLMAGIDIIPPLFSLFSGVDLPKNVADTLTKVDRLDAPYGALLATLSTGANQAISRPLRVGRYTVLTAFSKVTVDIYPIASMVLDDRFRTDFSASLKTAGTSISATDDPDATRSKVDGAVDDLGFHSTADHAFALFLLARRAGLHDEGMMKTLGKEYAAAIAEFPPKIRKLFKGMAAINADSVADVFSSAPDNDLPDVKQPAPDRVQNVAYQVIADLSAYGRADPEPATPRATLVKALAPTVLIHDLTTANLLQEGSKVVPAADLAKTLRALGFRRFGCQVPTDDQTIKRSVDGAGWTFLAFKVEAKATAAKAADAYAIRVLFDKSKVAALRIFDDPKAYVIPVLVAQSYSCASLQISPPPKT